MISTREGFGDLSERLLGAMDRQLEMLQVKTVQVEQLRRAIVGRDNAAMESLLAQMEQGQREQSVADRELDGLVSALAAEVGLPQGRAKLSVLAEHLPQEQALAIRERSRAMSENMKRLRRKHMEMSLLLHECQKINQLLLETLLNEGAGPRTYGANGHVRGRSSGGVMSAEL